MKAQILFEDEHLIVAYKPYGVLSEHDDKKPNMPLILKEMTGGEIYPVHRLDRTTQGLMVFAKTPEAAKRLSAMIQNGGIEKTYLAAVQGAPDEPNGEMTDLLFFDRRKNKSYAVKRKRAGVKDARLRYELLDTAELDGKEISLLRISLYTGRTHQIRVQFASRRMPLVGDRRYGSDIPSENIALCSSELCFIHPFTVRPLDFLYIPQNDAFSLFAI